MNTDTQLSPGEVVMERNHYKSLTPRANLIIVREHLQNAMRAGLNSEALKYVIQAIRELER